MTNHDAARQPEDLARLFNQHANAGNVDGLVALYESDAVVAVGRNTVATGHKEIRCFYTDLLAKKSDFPAGEQLPPVCNGPLAITTTRQDNVNLSVEVARQQADGSWRWVIDQLKIKAGLPE